MRLRIPGVVVVAFFLGALAAGSAAALQPGVFIDPTSPAGKEYSYPLSVLRGEGAGKPTPSEAIPEPLFGVGITPALTVGSAAAGQTRSHSPSGRSGGSGGKVTRGSGSTGVRLPTSETDTGLARLASPGSTFPLTALIVVAVLVLGGALGVGIGRLGRRGL